MTGATELYCNTGYFVQPHDVIFNRLDFWHTNNGNQVYYDAAEFEKALPTFKNIPLVYAKKHSYEIGTLPLDEALANVDGKIVGSLQDIQVNNTGSPTLRGSLNITDPTIDDLIQNGRAYMSTAFYGKLAADSKLTDIRGNHILIYPADPGLPYPNDPAALFLNQSKGLDDKNNTRGHKMATEEKTDIDPSRELIANQSTRIEEQATLIANQKAQLDEKDGVIAKKDELITNQNKEIEKLNGQLKAIRDAEKAKERELFLNQYAEGVVAKFKDRLPELDDPEKMFGLILAMNQEQAKVKPFEDKKADGQQYFSNQDETDDSKEADEAWGKSNVRF